VTSHLLGDISGIAAQATLLADGRVARRGAMEDLLLRGGERAYRVTGGPEIDAMVRDAVESAGGRVLDAGPARGTIEQLFLETYRGDRGEGGDGAPPARGR
jgi:hypothetical protein